eukprot:5563419-Amphidinium_carterae.1
MGSTTQGRTVPAPPSTSSLGVSNNSETWIPPCTGGPKSGCSMVCLNKQRDFAHLAREVKSYPLTLYDLSNWSIVKLIIPVLRTAVIKGVMWIGEPGLGKTPLANTIATPMSAYWHEREDVPGVPSFKTGTDLDFFRTDPGRKTVPSIFDDGTTSSVDINHLKSFLDVQAEDPAVRARYNAAKLEQHQFRQLCTNTYDSECEPMPYELATNIPHADFMTLVRPAFRKDASRADIVATMKRAWTVVLGKNQVYMRSPDATEVEAMVFPYPKGRPITEALLNPSGVAKLHKSKTLADKSLPLDFDDEMSWSMALLALCLNEHTDFDCFQPDG